MKKKNKGVSVIMPVYNQASFITRAIESLKNQVFKEWELLLIDDGSSDALEEVIGSYLSDNRIRYFKNPYNKGLGYSLNKGLENARFAYVSYLPADDLYYKDHLNELYNLLESDAGLVLSYSGIKHHYNKSAEGKLEGYPLQLVQVMHKGTAHRWLERDELVTDDLGRMFWNKLEDYGRFAGTGKITCEWVDHPSQRHKIIQEPVGGINPYKLYYKVKHPLRYHSTVGNYIDEFKYYQQFRERKSGSPNSESLKIVLVGELAYNAERILALEEQGHKLYGLWMKDPYWYNTVGPLPFSHVEDIPYESWQKKFEEIKPDIIYGLLNWQAVPFAHEILTHNPGIPFVWHFKEGPFICLEKGTWDQLIELYSKSDGQIYSSIEMKDWFHQFLNGNQANSFVLDGDLPKKEWFSAERASKLSEKDGEIHTVVPGRPIGLHPHTVAELAEFKIHLHFYGDFTHGQWRQWIEKTQTLAPGYLHIHPNCTQENWVKEFSQYDAGWLHFFQSENNRELMRANWDDLNIPARMATLAVAGLPMLQRDNSGHIVATQSLAKQFNLGIFFTSIEDLSRQLNDKVRLEQIGSSVWKNRFHFSFDHHTDSLVRFFRRVIDSKKEEIATTKAIA